MARDRSLREGTEGFAGRVYDKLVAHFGKDQVFMDIDTVRPGAKFADVIEQTVGVCDALIALIGRQWLSAAEDEGERRLDNPDDWVRMEITKALERDILVIPALFGGASVPKRSHLPENLADLADRHALEVSHTRFHSDVDLLIDTLGRERSRSRGELLEPGEPSAIAEPPKPQEEPKSRASLKIRLEWDQGSKGQKQRQPKYIGVRNQFNPLEPPPLGPDDYRTVGARPPALRVRIVNAGSSPVMIDEVGIAEPAWPPVILSGTSCDEAGKSPPKLPRSIEGNGHFVWYVVPESALPDTSGKIYVQTTTGVVQKGEQVDRNRFEVLKRGVAEAE